MLKVENQKNNMMLLRAVFKGDELPQNLVEKANKVTEYFDKNEAVVFLGEEKNYNYDTVFNFAKLYLLTKLEIYK
ncbi:hypothetical protein ONA02_04040 [Mycoplasmopsis felis]|nr:hypothetical protein [Mycoplasmopsis felis]WAM01820.1 hypothetical protein ONA02_04040 [Mycoplasmopsis felis]